MSIPTGLWMSCSLALLSVALSASLQNVDSVEPIARHCQKIPSGQDIVAGSGLKANYHPYYLITSGPDRAALELYSSSGDHCTVNLPEPRTSHYGVVEASPKILYLFEYNIRRRIFSVDTSTCATHDISDKFDKSRGDPTYYALVVYEDGFDKIFKDNNETYFRSYDFAGNRIGQPRRFLHDAEMYYIIPTSPKSRTSNLIDGNFEVVKSDDKYMKMNLDLVDAGGRMIKHLFTFEYNTKLRLPVVYDSGDSTYTYCYHGRSEYVCAQFDQSGKEILRNSISYDGKKSGDNGNLALLSVHNLKNGPGFVLFAATYENTTESLPSEVLETLTFKSPATVKAIAIEVRPGKTTEKSYYLADKQFHPVTVTNYDEVSGQFTVRMRLHKTEELCSTTFSLATKQD